MPNINPYDAPSGLGLQPTEIGADSFQSAARRLGAYGNQIADARGQEGRIAAQTIGDTGQVIVDNATRAEISRGAKVDSQMWFSLTQQWEDAKKNADPNDTTVAKKFQQEVLEPALDNFQQGFNTEKGQSFAEQKADQLRQHFFVATSADMSTLAGIAVKKNLSDSTIAMSNTAITDPSAVPALLKGLDHSIDGILSASPNISAIDSARVRAEVSDASKRAIVMAGVEGAIQKSSNPEATADEWIRKYPDYISGANAKTLAGYARQQIRANNYDVEVNRRRDKEIATDKSNAAQDQYITDIRSQDPRLANDPTAKKILNDPSLLPAAKNTLLNFIDRQNKDEKVVDDPVAKSDLMTRMFSADNPTTTLDLMKARADGKISDHTFQAYHGLVQELEQAPLKGPVWHDTIEAVKSELVLSNVGLPGKDITGEGNYAKWAQTFIPQYLSAQRAGTLPANALDVKDPNSLISQSMAPFKRTVQQRVEDYLSVFKGTPGETVPVVGRKVGDVPVPPALGGIASLQYNKATKQFRDQTTGTIYDSAGTPVAR